MELTVHYEKIVTNMARWKSGEKDRASDAVEPAAPGKPSYDPDADLSEIGVGPQHEPAPMDDEIAEETIAFEEHLAQVSEAAE